MISTGRLALYALPALPLALPVLPAAVLLPAHYAGTLGLGLGAVALALTAARALDVVTDPLVGALSDRSGVRKPWIAAGAVLAGVALVRLFDPPTGAGAWHLFGWSVLLYLGWTLVQVPYQAWGADMDPGYHQRARIAGWREGVGVLGLLAAGALSTLGLPAVAWAAVILGGPAVALALWRVPEASTVPATPVTRHALRAIAGNGPFRRLLAAWVLNGVAAGVPAVLFPFFIGHGLAAADRVGVFLLLYFLAAVAAVPGWLRLARRGDEPRAWCIAMAAACAAFAPVPLLGPGDGGWFALVCVVTGAALGADLALPPAMQADVIDYGALRAGGARRTGLYMALWTMGTKGALALSVATALPLAAAFGFDPRAAVQPPGALAALALLYAGLPTAAKLGAVALVWGYPLTERRHAAIRRRLDRRTQGVPP